MDVPKVLTTIGFVRHNILFIGRKSSWIVNARAEKQYNLVGTQFNYGFDSKLSDYHNWPRLLDQVKRYASIGATITVYALHNVEDTYREVGTIMKQRNTVFQLPGCSLPCISGVRVRYPAIIPIPVTELGNIEMQGWDEMVDKVKQTIVASYKTK